MIKSPLVVDLDGTLIKTDVLHESFVTLAILHPLRAITALCTLFRHGRAAMKAEIAGHDLIDTDTLPLREDFLSWLQTEAANGRALHLVSAAHHSAVERVAARVAVFSSHFGSDGKTNLKGENKAAFLQETFPGGFSYAGDSAADIAVWRRAETIVLVGAAPSVRSRAENLGKPVETSFSDQTVQWRALLRQFRLHQWAKNLLVFMPIILAHRFHDTTGWLHSLYAFLALCLTATATYIINDLVDLRSDRKHSTKRRRPLASGSLPVLKACVAAPIVLAAGIGLAFAAGTNAAIVLAAYLALTLAYSLRFKRVALLDTTFIGLLFTLRIVMGCAAADLAPSPWLLAFSLMLFFSLALAKRQTEIAKKAAQSGAHAIDGRGYQVLDGALTLPYGVSSGMASLVILMLYTANGVAAGLYRHPEWLWAVPLFMYIWQMRIWLYAHRGLLDDDPIVFALKDRASLALGAGCAVAFYMAL